jgi:hypothetical protein
VGLAVGNDPKGLKFAVVNHEIPFNSTCKQGTGCPLNDNYSGFLSCQFIDFLDGDHLEMVKRMMMSPPTTTSLK